MTKRTKHTIPKIILLLLILTLYVNVACAPSVVFGSPSGSVAIWSDQLYSDIYIDGVYSGLTGSELVWYDLSVGTHKVKIIQSGYDNWTDEIYVSSDEIAYVEAYLIQQIERTGSVAIWADQTYSDIYIDGVYSGLTGSEWVWYDLSVGTHKVKIVQSGYDDWTSSIYVPSNEDTYVEAYLIQQIEQTGSVAVWSDQTYSEIYIDGAYFGQTGSDWIWYDVPVGTHKIEISQSGYDKWTDEIYVSSDKVAYVEAYLTQYDRGRYSDEIYQDNSSDDGGFIILLILLFFILYMLRGIRKARKKKAARERDAAEIKSKTKSSEQVITPQPKMEMQPEDVQPSDQTDNLITSSAFGYKGATIQYKVKVENPTSEPISDIKIHIFVPDVFLSDDSEKSISILEPGEGKTVTFEIRPTGECGDCNVSGRVNYYDYSTKKRQEMDIETKSLSVVCPLLKIKEITLAEWRSTISHFVKTEESTKEISMPAETLFGMASRVIEDMNMFMLDPEISSTPQMYDGVARFYGIGVKDLKYAAQIEVVGGTKKSKLILKAWAEREEALIGFYHGILDEIEKRVQVKGLIETDMVQNIYQYGDRIGTQVKDSFVYKSKVEADEAKSCPQCGKEKGEGEKFCSVCGTKF